MGLTITTLQWSQLVLPWFFQLDISYLQRLVFCSGELLPFGSILYQVTRLAGCSCVYWLLSLYCVWGLADMRSNPDGPSCGSGVS